MTASLPPHLEVTAQTYELHDWVAKAAERRARYFVGLDRFQHAIASLTPHGASDAQLVGFIQEALGQDKTFIGHILEWKGAANLADKSFWEQVLEAGAIAIVQAYATACANREWPRAS